VIRDFLLTFISGRPIPEANHAATINRAVSEFRISAVGKYEYRNPRMQQDLREFLADDPAIQRSLRLSLCLMVSP
jgi:hypothetical protein